MCTLFSFFVSPLNLSSSFTLLDASIFFCIGVRGKLLRCLCPDDNYLHTDFSSLAVFSQCLSWQRFFVKINELMFLDSTAESKVLLNNPVDSWTFEISLCPFLKDDFENVRYLCVGDFRHGKAFLMFQTTTKNTTFFIYCFSPIIVFHMCMHILLRWNFIGFHLKLKDKHYTWGVRTAQQINLSALEKVHLLVLSSKGHSQASVFDAGLKIVLLSFLLMRIKSEDESSIFLLDFLCQIVGKRFMR